MQTEALVRAGKAKRLARILERPHGMRRWEKRKNVIGRDVMDRA
jgi:hypothetical protein